MTAFLLTAAFLLDFLMGDPRLLPHPVRLMGRFITSGEDLLRSLFPPTPRGEKWGGLLLVAGLVGLTLFLSWLLAALVLSSFSSFTPGSAALAILLIYLTASTLALRELIDSTQAVQALLNAGELAGARSALALIVGRDTEKLQSDGIHRALLETLSENLSDGFVAPLFYLILGGLPLALAYKAVNTLDSMVGYKNDRYRHFGWAAARLDDVAGFVPARITALLIILAAGILRGKGAAKEAWQTMRQDGPKHASPNAGLPEAAFAGALGVGLGGPATYGGIVTEKPWLGRERGGNYEAAFPRGRQIALLAALLGLAWALVATLAGAY
jgi:adenosylcobinamide-phosphate synthase